MRLEPTTTNNDSDEMRAWLDDSEKESLLRYYNEDPRRQIAISLMLRCGFRSKEVTHATKDDIVRLDTEEDAYRIRVWEGKSGYRRTPLPTDLKMQIVTYANSLRLGKNDELINVTPRTVQNWVKWAAEDLGGYDEGTGSWEQEDWSYVSAHDLRRTWGTDTVQSGVPESVVMQWGGWDDYKTFKDHYLGSASDRQTLEYMHRAGLD